MPCILKTQWARRAHGPCGCDIFGVTWSNFEDSKMHYFRDVQVLTNVFLYVSPLKILRLRGDNEWQKWHQKIPLLMRSSVVAT